MKERPILFNSEMVRATLDDRKSHTRRVVKKYPAGCIDRVMAKDGSCDIKFIRVHTFGNLHAGLSVTKWIKCPYGKPGDHLWVRETFSFYDSANTEVQYRADYPNWRPGGWKPSIHMPRWASRITLEIVNVRVERVQDITEEDALAEGIEQTDWAYSCEPYRNYNHPKMMTGRNCSTPIMSFSTLWDSINKKRGFGWQINPWVWVVEFKRIKEG